MHANPTEETVALELDGETYTLFFSLEAIAQAEDATGLALITGLRQKDANAPRLSLVRALFWACLLPHQPKITREQASAMVTQWNWSGIWEKVIAVWVEGMRPPEVGADPTRGQS